MPPQAELLHGGDGAGSPGTMAPLEFVALVFCLMAGTAGRRIALPNATVLLHQPLGGFQVRLMPDMRTVTRSAPPAVSALMPRISSGRSAQLDLDAAVAEIRDALGD